MSGENDHIPGVDVEGPDDKTPYYDPNRVTLPDEGKIVFALAIPHTPWRPERVASLAKLLEMLGHRPKFFKVFDEKAPNWVWSRKLWQWGADMAKEGATHLLQLQDDVRPMPEFWPVLRAMVEANPQRWIGLQVNHPHARQLAHNGRRWYKDRWLVGCQYVAPLQGPDSLQVVLGLLAASDALPDGHPDKLTAFQHEHEDVTIASLLDKSGRDVWHPIPAIADVDLSIGSTYETTPGHIDDHRRPTVTWHGFPTAMLKDPLYWQVPSQVERIAGPGPGPCSSCGKRLGSVPFGNFIKLCNVCWLRGHATLAGITMGEPK